MLEGFIGSCSMWMIIGFIIGFVICHLFQLIKKNNLTGFRKYRFEKYGMFWYNINDVLSEKELVNMVSLNVQEDKDE